MGLYFTGYGTWKLNVIYFKCFFFFSLGLLFVWIFYLFIMFVNSLDSGSVAKRRVLSREHTHGSYNGRICKKAQQLQELSIQKFSNVLNCETYFPYSQVKAVAINKNQQL